MVEYKILSCDKTDHKINRISTTKYLFVFIWYYNVPGPQDNASTDIIFCYVQVQWQAISFNARFRIWAPPPALAYVWWILVQNFSLTLFRRSGVQISNMQHVRLWNDEVKHNEQTYIYLRVHHKVCKVHQLWPAWCTNLNRYIPIEHKLGLRRLFIRNL